MVSKKNDAKAVIGLIDLGAITTVIVPVLYTAGWSFAYHYFDHFHLGMQGLNIQKEYLFLYGFWVIKNQWLFSIIAIIIMAISYIGVRLFLNIPKNESEKSKLQSRKLSLSFNPHIRQCICVVLVPVLVLGLFVLFYQLGDRAADTIYAKQAESDYSSYPRVVVGLNSAAEKEVGPIAAEWSNGCYRLLLRNKAYLYIFYSGGYKEETPTEVIPQENIRLLRILSLYHSSGKCRS